MEKVYYLAVRIYPQTAQNNRVDINRRIASSIYQWEEILLNFLGTPSTSQMCWPFQKCIILSHKYKLQNIKMSRWKAELMLRIVMCLTRLTWVTSPTVLLFSESHIISYHFSTYRKGTISETKMKFISGSGAIKIVKCRISMC